MGIFMGVGFAALPMTSQATFLSNWFIRKRGLAIGTAASGIGLGIFGCALDAVADRHVWLARGVFHPRGCVGDRNRAFELFLSTPEARGDESQARFRRLTGAASGRTCKDLGLQRSKFKGGAANLAILGFAFGVLCDPVAHGVDPPGGGGQRRWVL